MIKITIKKRAVILVFLTIFFVCLSINLISVRSLSYGELPAYPLPEDPTNHSSHDTSEPEWNLIQSDMTHIRFYYTLTHLYIDVVIHDDTYGDHMDVLTIFLDFDPLPDYTLHDACIWYVIYRDGDIGHFLPNGPDSWTSGLDGSPNANIDIYSSATRWDVRFIISITGFGVNKISNVTGFHCHLKDRRPDEPVENRFHYFYYPSSNFDRYAWGDIILMEPEPTTTPTDSIPSFSLPMLFLMIFGLMIIHSWKRLRTKNNLVKK